MGATRIVDAQLERSVQRRKLIDQLFVLTGMIILFASLLTLALLFNIGGFFLTRRFREVY